jgi:hypothetical protein
MCMMREPWMRMQGMYVGHDGRRESRGICVLHFHRRCQRFHHLRAHTAPRHSRYSTMTTSFHVPSATFRWKLTPVPTQILVDQCVQLSL